jgi:hypothetical protein
MLHPIHLEVRLAFRSCARTNSISKSGCRYFNSFPTLRAQKRDASRAVECLPATDSMKEVVKAPNTTQPSPPKEGQRESSENNTKGLVPRIPQPGTLQRPRRLEVPARLLPKAQISPGLTLSPKERLQIEYETRRPPQASDKRGEHGEISGGRKCRLTISSLQRAPVDLSSGPGIYQLYSPGTSYHHGSRFVRSGHYGSSVLFL